MVDLRRALEPERAPRPAAVASSAPAGAVISTCSTSGGVSPPCSAIVSARPASPIRKSAIEPRFVPVAAPAPTHSSTKPTHAAIAHHGCRALHTAARTVPPLPITRRAFRLRGAGSLRCAGHDGVGQTPTGKVGILTTR
ncbi:hypothetical protein [Pseudonocardia sp. DLS-67]